VVHREQYKEGNIKQGRVVIDVAELGGSSGVRQTHRFDETRLATWLAGHIDHYKGPLEVEQFRGGQSNPTYKLITPEKSYVLRRKPPGPLLKGAHAIEREVLVQKAVERVGFPVPHVYALCIDENVLGTCFYVMDWIDGRIIWDATFPDVSRAQRPLYFEAMSTTLARLHSIDFRAIGLADYGRTGNYFERQIARWSRQYLGDVDDAGRDSNMERLVEWLSAHVPQVSDVSIVHGDFKVDNLVFHQSEPRILAVLDWELSTLGDPLSDFAYNLMMYRIPPRVIAGLAGIDLGSLNIPSEAEYVAAYCRRIGRKSIPHLDFYVVFNMFRLAAIFHGIKGRLARGTASSERARDYAAEFAWLAELAWQQAQSALP
jgi:aminoglycoside phosphotransferase (APT) family kinase protein